MAHIIFVANNVAVCIKYDVFNDAHFCARQTQVANTILQRMYDDSSILGDVFTSKYLTMDLVQ